MNASGQGTQAEQIPAMPPRAFISYSWTSEEHATWVRELATRLRADGVDVVLDQWDLKPGHDRFQFMESMVTDPTVTHVIALSDRRYADRADGRDGGVGTETQILSPEVYAKSRQERVIPVFLERGDDGEPTLPTFLRHTMAVDMSTPVGQQDGYDELLRILHGRPRFPKPSLGTAPAHLLADSPRPARARLRSFQESFERDRPTTRSQLAEFYRAALSELQPLTVDAPDPKRPLEDLVVERLHATLPVRDDVLTVLAAVAGNPNATFIKDTSRFLEDLAQLNTIGNCHRHDGRNDHFRVLTYELVLSWTALHLRLGNDEILRTFTDQAFRNPEHGFYEGRPVGRFHVLKLYTPELEEQRNRRLFAGRRYSVTADLLKERATHPAVSFEELVQADVVLYAKSLIANDGLWYPSLLGYAGHGLLPFFARATYHEDFARIRTIFGVNGGDDFRARFAAGAEAQLGGDALRLNAPIQQLLNLKDLDSRL